MGVVVGSAQAVSAAQGEESFPHSSVGSLPRVIDSPTWVHPTGNGPPQTPSAWVTPRGCSPSRTGCTSVSSSLHRLPRGHSLLSGTHPTQEANAWDVSTASKFAGVVSFPYSAWPSEQDGFDYWTKKKTLTHTLVSAALSVHESSASETLLSDFITALLSPPRDLTGWHLHVLCHAVYQHCTLLFFMTASNSTRLEIKWGARTLEV